MTDTLDDVSREAWNTADGRHHVGPPAVVPAGVVTGEAAAIKRAPPPLACQSNSSGSVRTMSSHRGWKLNQPASGKPVCSRV